jgi:aspartate beta-hydroxylase
MNAAAPNKLEQEAVAALRVGDCKKAREAFERVVSMGQAGVSTWLGLAFACAQLGDNTATLAALDKSLELEPQNIRAIIFKADHLQLYGESRKAVESYGQALRLASQMGALPDDVKQGLLRAQEVCGRKEEEYKSFLIERLTADGFSPGQSSRRFRESLDILLGLKEVFYQQQQPRRYYFPGLPPIQFYDRDQFDWAEAVESATDEIRSELASIMNDPSRFTPYLQSDTAHLTRDVENLVDSTDWGALYLWDYGRLVPEAAATFPKTIEALKAAPMPVIQGQAPMALFSKLTPGTRIPPHNGLLNTRLICHLPIIVPENCGALRVGSEERPWVEGEMLIFDDSIEHEAWNLSAEERVVLLFEVWRPELNDEERRLVNSMLRAVREYFTD